MNDIDDLHNRSFTENIAALSSALEGLYDASAEESIEEMTAFMAGTGNPLSNDNVIAFAALKYQLISDDQYDALWDQFAAESVAGNNAS